jgi:tetratricopeptide (TPR) repeat protein
MLKPKKKITKKEIKQDKLVTRFMQTETWVLDNQKLLAYIGAGIVAIVLVIFVWTDRAQTMESEAATRLAGMLPVYDGGDMQQAIDGLPAQGKFGLQSIVDEYGSTESGNLAKLYLGNALLSQGKAEEALEVYGDISGSTRLLESSVFAAEGAAYESMRQHEDAARSFERSVSADPTNPLCPDRLIQAAANFSKAGEGERALEVLKTLKKQYPQSVGAREVERYMAEFAS